jgi:hypothetical protein
MVGTIEEGFPEMHRHVTESMACQGEAKRTRTERLKKSEFWHRIQGALAIRQGDYTDAARHLERAKFYHGLREANHMTQTPLGTGKEL